VIKESAVIRKRGNNWRVIVYADRDPLSGRKRQKTGTAKTKAEAKQLEARLITEAATGRHRSAGTKTVAELVEAWYQWRQGVRPISPNTLANYRRYIAIYGPEDPPGAWQGPGWPPGRGHARSLLRSAGPFADSREAMVSSIGLRPLLAGLHGFRRGRIRCAAGPDNRPQDDRRRHQSR
jgi:hypothetical protein